jgi:hypothetical protein
MRTADTRDKGVAGAGLTCPDDHPLVERVGVGRPPPRRFAGAP